MYSPEIIERRLHAAKKAGLQFQRLPRDTCLDITGKLETLRLDGRGELLPKGKLSRDLDGKETAFIKSERLICKADFHYYAVRYHNLERDPGVGNNSGIGPAPYLESQNYLLRAMGRREQQCYEEKKKYGRTTGIRIYAHKTRQVAFTTTARQVTLQRMVFYPGSRCFAATLKDIGELYKRDLLAFDNLPFWLKPDELYPNVKDEEIGIPAPVNSRLVYQADTAQAANLGTGTQQDVSHLTEVPLWQNPYRIRYSFLPAVPNAETTWHMQEGTSAGKGGYWYEVSEGCRNRRMGYEDYIYIFIPWYINAAKYVGNAPDSWTPKDHTVKHAELIERTSPEFCEGVTFKPSRDQLYWWEKNRSLYAEVGELAAFLASYPATPEQSFVNASQGALPVEWIEEMELDCRPPKLYSMEVSAA